MSQGMNNVRTLIISSALVYGTLAVLIGVVPGVTQSQAKPTPGLLPFTPTEERGREVYVSEGCAYCHSQVVRPIMEDKIYGRPSVGGDYVYDTPELLGDHRNGPDLTNIGNRQPSSVWQYIHLWDPRALVSDSIMPSYRWLFRIERRASPGEVTVPVPEAFAPPQGIVVPTQRARDLVKYLLALKQTPLKAAK